MTPEELKQKQSEMSNHDDMAPEFEDHIQKARKEAIKKLKADDFYVMLLMASYCGEENPDCTDELPCEDCLKMCNIVLVPKISVTPANIIGGYNFLKI